MARRRVKKRTHVGAPNGPKATAQSKSMDRSPRSMVIRIGAGEVGPSVSQLVKDVRQIMEPGTASRLKERKSNKLRDYTTMAGPLGVTHLLLFSRSSSGNTNMRLALTPRGPTLHFRVEKYSLCKDIYKSMKHPRTGTNDFQTAPLLVMNNFTTPTPADGSTEAQVPKHLESLVTTVFQSLFPPISPQTTPLSSIKRVLLINREPPSDPANGTYTVNLRHYAITTKRTDISKAIRRLNAAEKLVTGREKRKKGLPNLGKLEDVADYLLDPDAGGGYTSASESEIDTDVEVEVLAPQMRKVMNRRDRERAAARAAEGKSANGVGRPSVEKRAVKLVELGPRMRLRLTKVEESVCGGKVMWHEFITKSKDEEKRLDELWETRRKEKEERRRIQKENIERKKKHKGEGGESEVEVDDEELEMDDDEWDSEGLEDEGGVKLENEGVDEDMEDEDMEE
ncbi:Brix-domain-containing protein [Patellaria atrata CBS 101060]|uniref:Brix-domain-containing protein n=1 Tax=Patellaria atrata CBS 101060 TaxID=1346257 RepID=A0A9P4VVU3_9PEZI|nr:Brix-domain-containing protein [Patellaria atrata CBS 101060]